MYGQASPAVGFSYAVDAASNSVCDRKHVGAVVMNASGRPVAFGHNRIPGFSGFHCSEVCPRGRGESMKSDYSDCPAIHAEVDALASLASSHAATERMTMYITATPCVPCARIIALNGKIARVFWIRSEKESHISTSEVSQILTDSGKVVREYDVSTAIENNWVSRGDLD